MKWNRFYVLDFGSMPTVIIIDIKKECGWQYAHVKIKGLFYVTLLDFQQALIWGYKSLCWDFHRISIMWPIMWGCKSVCWDLHWNSNDLWNLRCNSLCWDLIPTGLDFGVQVCWDLGWHSNRLFLEESDISELSQHTQFLREVWFQGCTFPA